MEESGEEADKVVLDVFTHDQHESVEHFEKRLFAEGVTSLQSFCSRHADFGGSTYNALLADLKKLRYATDRKERVRVLELQHRVKPMLRSMVRAIRERSKAEHDRRHHTAERFRSKSAATQVISSLEKRLSESFPIPTDVKTTRQDWFTSTIDALRNRRHSLVKYRKFPQPGYQKAAEILDRKWEHALVAAREGQKNERRSQQLQGRDRAPTEAPLQMPVPTPVWLPENEAAFKASADEWMRKFGGHITEITQERQALKAKAKVMGKEKNLEGLAAVLPEIKQLKDRIHRYERVLTEFKSYLGSSGQLKPPDRIERYAEKQTLASELRPPLRRIPKQFVAPAGLARPETAVAAPKPAPPKPAPAPPKPAPPKPKPKPAPRPKRPRSPSDAGRQKPRPSPLTGAAGTSSVSPSVPVSGGARKVQVAANVERTHFEGETAQEYLNEYYRRGYKDTAEIDKQVYALLAQKKVFEAAKLHRDLTKGNFLAKPVAPPKPVATARRDYSTNKDRDDFFNTMPYVETSKRYTADGAYHYRKAPRASGRPEGFRLVGPAGKSFASPVPVFFEQTPEEQRKQRHNAIDSHHHLDPILLTAVAKANHPARFHPVPPFDIDERDKSRGKENRYKYKPDKNLDDLYNPNKPFAGYNLDHRASFDNVEQALRSWGFDPDRPMGDLVDMHPTAFRPLTRQTLSIDALHIGAGGNWVKNSQKDHGTHPLMGGPYFMPQNSRQRRDNPLGPKTFSNAKVPNAYLVREDGTLVWDEKHKEAWRSVPQRYFRPWLPWAVDAKLKPTHTDFKARNPQRHRIDKLRPETMAKFDLKAGDKHAYYEHPLKGPTSDANLSWVLPRGSGTRKTHASFKLQKGGGRSARAVSGPANWQWLGNERPDEGTKRSVLNEVDGKAGRSLQQYFEGFQASMFGHVLTPYQDMMRYYGPKEVKLDPELKAPIEKALQEHNIDSDEQRDAARQLLEKLPVDPGEDHNNVFGGLVRDPAERGQKYFNHRNFMDLMDKAFPDHEGWRDESGQLRGRKNAKIWKVARKVLRDRLWNLRGAQGKPLTSADLYAIQQGRGQRKPAKTAAAVDQTKRNRALAAAKPVSLLSPPPLEAPDLPPAVVLSAGIQSSAPLGGTSAVVLDTDEPLPAPQIPTIQEMSSFDHEPVAPLEDMSKPGFVQGPLAGYHQPGAPAVPVLSFFKLKHGEQARDIQHLIRQHHDSHRPADASAYRQWFDEKLKGFRSHLAERGHFPHGKLTKLGTSRYVQLAAQKQLDVMHGTRKMHAPIGKHQYQQVDTADWAQKEMMHEGSMLELADFQRRHGSTPEAPKHAWERTREQMNRAEAVVHQSGEVALLRSLKENLDFRLFGRHLAARMQQRADTFGDAAFSGQVATLLKGDQDERAVDLVVDREHRRRQRASTARDKAANIKKVALSRIQDLRERSAKLAIESEDPKVQAIEKLKRDTDHFLSMAGAYIDNLERAAKSGKLDAKDFEETDYLLGKLEAKVAATRNPSHLGFTQFRDQPDVFSMSSSVSNVGPYQPMAPVMPAHYGPQVHNDPAVMGLVSSFQRQRRVTARPVTLGEMGYRIQHQHLSRHAGVAMVHMGGLHDDQHFMKDIEGDVNMGRRAVLDKRRGPFRREQGASRVMARTANTVIRKRRMQLEITVTKNVQSHELDVLFGKLRSHALAISGTIVYLVSGRSRKNLGTLDMLDLDVVRREILKLLIRSKQVGLLLIDGPGSGGMHHHKMHTARYARSYARENNSYSY